MSKIQVYLIDMAGNVTAMPLPDDKPIDSLLPSIVNLLDLTETDERGQTMPYRLFSRRFQQVITSGGTLYSNGIMADDELRIVPAVPEEAMLEFELLTDPGPGTMIPLYTDSRITIGRGSDNDIVIRHAAVSRHHGELVWQDGIHIYRDLNSANGSFINNHAVAEPMPLASGSILSLGESIRLHYRHSMDLTDSSDEKVILQDENGESLDSTVMTGLTPLPRGSVFVAYERSTLHVASNIVDELRQANFHIYWDQEIPPGSNINEALYRDLRLADVLLVILTPAAINTPAVTEQCNEFILNRKPIVPVVYEPCEIPKMLQNMPVVQFRGSFTRMTSEIVSALIRAFR